MDLIDEQLLKNVIYHRLSNIPFLVHPNLDSKEILDTWALLMFLGFISIADKETYIGLSFIVQYPFIFKVGTVYRRQYYCDDIVNFYDLDYKIINQKYNKLIHSSKSVVRFS